MSRYNHLLEQGHQLRGATENIKGDREIHVS